MSGVAKAVDTHRTPSPEARRYEGIIKGRSHSFFHHLARSWVKYRHQTEVLMDKSGRKGVEDWDMQRGEIVLAIFKQNGRAVRRILETVNKTAPRFVLEMALPHVWCPKSQPVFLRRSHLACSILYSHVGSTMYPAMWSKREETCVNGAGRCCNVGSVDWNRRCTLGKLQKLCAEQDQQRCCYLQYWRCGEQNRRVL